MKSAFVGRYIPLLILFVLVYFEFERAFGFYLSWRFTYKASVIHAVFYFFFSIYVFRAAAKEGKCVYDKRTRVIFYVTLILCTFYYATCFYVYSDDMLTFTKFKLFVWCSYFVVLRQFLAIIDRRIVFKIILIVTIALFMSPLVYDCKRKYAFESSYHVNWIGYFSCLLCYYFCSQLASKKYKLCIWGALVCYLYYNQGTFSFLVALYILPIILFPRGAYFVFFIFACCVVLYLTKSGAGGYISRKLRFGVVAYYKEVYIKGTNLDVAVINRLHGKRCAVWDKASGRPLHNFFATLFVHYNLFELVVFLLVFLKYVKPSCAILIACYCLTMTDVLHFFVAFTMLSCDQKKKDQS